MAFRIIQPNYISGPPAGSTLLSGLVAAYSLNEGATGPWVDDGPDGFDISSVASPAPTSMTSRTGSGITMVNTTLGHIYSTGSSGVFDFQSFTIAQWIYLTSSESTAAITCFGSGNKDTASAMKCFTYADYTRFGLRVMSPSDVLGELETALSEVALNEWHLWIATYDASTGAMSLYRDDGTSNWSGSSGFTAISTFEDGIGIGGNSGSSTIGKEFIGGIEDVFIWNRVLSASERAEFWNSGSGVKFGDL